MTGNPHPNQQLASRTTPWRAPGVASAALMGILLVLYLALAGWQGIVLLGTGNGVGIAMGAALLVFPIVGIWAVCAEFRFGAAATALVQQLDATDLAPMTHPEVTSNHTDRAALRELAKTLQPADTETSWQPFMVWSLALDDAGLRKEARAAARDSIRRSRLEQEQSRSER